MRLRWKIIAKPNLNCRKFENLTTYGNQGTWLVMHELAPRPLVLNKPKVNLNILLKISPLFYFCFVCEHGFQMCSPVVQVIHPREQRARLDWPGFALLAAFSWWCQCLQIKIFLFVCLSIGPNIGSSISPLISGTVRLSVRPSVRPPVHPSIHSLLNCIILL